MSGSLNKVMIIGNLGADPDIRMTQGGTKIANLSVATSEKWKDRDGAQQEHTEWHKVAFFGPVAEVCEKYLKKGSSVYIEGSIRTDKWQDKEGNNRYTTEIRGRNMQMLGGRSGGGGGGDYGGSSGGGDYNPPADLSDDDIPF